MDARTLRSATAEAEQESVPTEPVAWAWIGLYRGPTGAGDEAGTAVLQGSSTLQGFSTRDRVGALAEVRAGWSCSPEDGESAWAALVGAIADLTPSDPWVADLLRVATSGGSQSPQSPWHVPLRRSSVRSVRSPERSLNLVPDPGMPVQPRFAAPDRRPPTTFGPRGPSTDGSAPSSQGTDARVSLTPRELEVLRHLAQLLGTEETEAAMFVSVNTVRTHIRSILCKLGVTRRNVAVRRARELGLIDP